MSLEESQTFDSGGLSALLNEEKIIDLEKTKNSLMTKIVEFEAQNRRFKNELEEQVDVVLKMEEERLILIRNNKQIKQELETAIKGVKSKSSELIMIDKGFDPIIQIDQGIVTPVRDEDSLGLAINKTILSSGKKQGSKIKNASFIRNKTPTYRPV